jgi:hypothetical protein
VEYELIRSDRKTVGLQIRDGRLIVRAPRRMSRQAVEAILAEKRSWIENHLRKAREQLMNEAPKLSSSELYSLAQKALDVIPERVKHYAALVGVDYGRVTIRAQKTRWGSCSTKGNLNFNCLLMLAPPETLDAVVVHELCHRKVMDHSPAFYAEVLRVMPDYYERDRWLKENGSQLLRRLPQ